MPNFEVQKNDTALEDVNISDLEQIPELREDMSLYHLSVPTMINEGMTIQRQINYDVSKNEFLHSRYIRVQDCIAIRVSRQSDELINAGFDFIFPSRRFIIKYERVRKV